MPNTDMPSVCYWGCELKLHQLCLEANQFPRIRSWNEVVESNRVNPDIVAKMAVWRELCC